MLSFNRYSSSLNNTIISNLQRIGLLLVRSILYAIIGLKFLHISCFSQPNVSAFEMEDVDSPESRIGRHPVNLTEI
jgi:hypothetical protein